MAEVSCVVEGCVVVDRGNGLSTVTPIPAERRPEPAGFWERLRRWWSGAEVTPYVNVRDMSDPLGQLKNSDPSYDGSGSKKAVEVGVSVRF